MNKLSHDRIRAALSVEYMDLAVYVTEAGKLLRGRSPAELMELKVDEIIRDLIDYHCSAEYYGSVVLRGCLYLITDLLPDIPSRFYLDLERHNKQFSIEEYPEAIEKFATTNVDTLLKCAKICSDLIDHRRILFPFVTSLYYVPKEKLLELVNEDLIQFTERTFAGSNDPLKVIFTRATHVITDRIPNFSRERLLTVDNLLHMKRLCDYDDLVSHLYESFEMDALLKKKYSLDEMSRETARHLETGDAAKSSENLVLLVRNDDESQWGFTTFVLKSLTRFISDHLRKNEDSMRTFLTTLLSFSWKSPYEHRHDAGTFRLLVGRVTKILREGFKSYSECLSQASDYIVFMKGAANLLRDLYFINNSWYNCFDIFSASPLIDKEEFECEGIKLSSADAYWGSGSGKVGFLRSLASICPALFPLRVRQHLKELSLNHSLPKVFRVKRGNILSQFVKLARNTSENELKRRWCIEFYNEIATGDGPTKEFYSLVSKEFELRDLMSSDYTSEGANLPSQCDKEYDARLTKFYHVGMLMAKAFLDGYRLDIQSPGMEFFKQLMRDENVEFDRYHEVAKKLPQATSLIKNLLIVKRKKTIIQSDPTLKEDENNQMIANLRYEDDCSFDDLCINFTIPGRNVELIEGGANIFINPFNVEQYLESLTHAILNIEMRDEFVILKKGFHASLPPNELDMLLPEELESLFCGQQSEEWTIEYLQQCCSFDGFEKDSKPILFLFEILSDLKAGEQSMFLRFVSASSSLPHGGLKNLLPRLTIVRMSSIEEAGDHRLPTASACFNVLCLPAYSSIEITRNKLFKALAEGHSTFQLA